MNVLMSRKRNICFDVTRWISMLIWICMFICADASDKIVYIKEDKTWYGALDHCESMGGSLISPSDVNRTKNYVQENEEFWIGEVTTLSSWMDVLGCYKIKTLSIITKHVKIFNIAESSPAICEQMCQTYSRVFGLMGTKCFCVRNIASLPSLMTTSTKASAKKCNNTCTSQFPIGLCGGLNHFTIYKRVFGVFQVRYPCNLGCNCAVTECVSGVKSIQRASCQTFYAIHCGKQHGTRSYGTQSNRWILGVKHCYDDDDYLPSLDITCEQSTLIGPMWSSAFRNYSTLNINELPNNVVKGLQQNTSMCSSAQFRNISFGYFKKKDNWCNRTRIHFFCEISSSSELTTSTIQKNVTGIIIGSLIACLLVTSAIAVVVFILRKRIESTKKKESIDTNHHVSENSTETKENNGFTNDLTNSTLETKINESKHNTDLIDSGYDSIQINAGNYDTLRKHQDQAKEMKNKDTGYEMASIGRETESHYVYGDTVEGDYDLLNQKDERKIKYTDEEDRNFYSHMDDIDGTYDTTRTKSYNKDISDMYDHAKNVACDVKVYDPYDHTN